MNIKYLLLLFIVNLHFTVCSQVTTDQLSSPSVIDSTDFSSFLESLPDSSSSKIHAIQSSLQIAADTLGKMTNIALVLKSDLLNIDSRHESNIQINSFIENLDFLSKEVHSLKQAVTNLQTSESVDFELAYIVEIESMLNEEINKLAVPEIKISEKNSALKDNSQNLNQYTFDTNTSIKHNLNTFQDCSLKATIDEKTYTPLRHIFDYTPKKLKAHFINNDYIYTIAQVVKTDKSYFFNLQINIHSSLARDTYGGVEKGSALRIELIKGDKIILYNVKRDFGTFNDETEKMVYNLVYPIEKDNLKSLAKFDIDKLGIIWTTGYEDYSIYETDFLINHISCLKSEK